MAKKEQGRRPGHHRGRHDAGQAENLLGRAQAQRRNWWWNGSHFVSLMKKNKFFSFPVVRGAISLYESLKIGYKALLRSSEIALDEGIKTRGKKQPQGIHFHDFKPACGAGSKPRFVHVPAYVHFAIVF